MPSQTPTLPDGTQRSVCLIGYTENLTKGPLHKFCFPSVKYYVSPLSVAIKKYLELVIYEAYLASGSGV